jgi:hypothetical protein
MQRLLEEVHKRLIPLPDGMNIILIIICFCLSVTIESATDTDVYGVDWIEARKRGFFERDIELF